MALFRGVLFNSASGSVDGVTFSHNRGGPYARARVVPVDPETPEQLAMRAAMTYLADRWTNTLTTDQRNAWQRFANLNRHTNRIGDERKISGRAEFFRANLIRRQAVELMAWTLPDVDDPSPISDTTPESPSFFPQIGLASAAQFDLTWNPEEEWATEANAALLWYLSDQKPPTINWFRSPYTLVAMCEVSMGGFNGPSVPAIAPLVGGNRLFWRARITRADGRLSPPWTGVLDIP